jgi:DNA-binding transcriptional LysR family regulator
VSALPDFEGWAIFAKVAELGSFSQAAADLNLSKATVSKALTRLERHLGTPLLHRSSRRLSLTDSGRSSLERANRILAEGEAIECEATDRTAEPRGVVRVAASITFGIQNLGAILPAFLERYPQITVDLRLADHKVDMVAEGIDIALRVGILDDSALRARRLLAIRRPLVAAPAYVAAQGRPAHPRDLEHHQVIIFTHVGSPMTLQFSHPLEGDCTVKVNGRLHLDNGDVAVQALLAGVGIALLPEFLVWQQLRDGRLVALLPEWAPPLSALHVVTPPGVVRPARVSVLIDFLAQHFQKAPWAYEPIVDPA